MTKPMTNQEVFDFVANHLHNQGQRSLSFAKGVESCAYRGYDTKGNPLSCAIGCLITDEDMKQVSESDNQRPIGYIFSIENYDNLFMNFRHISLPFLQELQIVHDTMSNWGSLDNMNNILERFAWDNALTYEKRDSSNSNIVQ